MIKIINIKATIKFQQEAIHITIMNLREKYENEIKQYAINAEKIAIKNIEKTLKIKEKNLSLEFEYFRDQNLADFREYYRQLIINCNLKYKNYQNDLKNEHNEKYENTKKLLKEKYKISLDSEKTRLQMKLQYKNTKLSVTNGDETIHNRIAWLKNQKAEKLKKLKQIRRDLEFCKGKIKIVLNNYENAVTLTEKRSSDIDYLLDKNKMTQKYLGPSTAEELKRFIQADE